MSVLSGNARQSMYDLALQIIEEEATIRDREARGLPYSTDICSLYDIADTEFKAERIKSLLDEVENLRRIVAAYRKAHGEIAVSRDESIGFVLRKLETSHKPKLRLVKDDDN